jgi:hypothetical protein
MIPIRLAALAAALTLVLSACGKSEEPASAASTADPAAHALLAHVPADTPYLAANLEPVPEDVLEMFLERLQPALDQAQSELSAALNESPAGASDDADRSEGHARLSLAVLREFDGKLSRSGLESLGLDLRAQQLFYGMGAFPVFRMSLGDPGALRGTVQRILENAGIEAPEREMNGRSYWRLSDDTQDHAPVGIYVSILDDHLALGVMPLADESTLLPAFLGLELPADNDALNVLSELNRREGYTNHGSGFVDFHRLADQFLQADTSLARLMSTEGDFDISIRSEECVKEIHAIIDNAPRMTMGATELTTDAVAYRYRLETPRTLASELLDLVARIPAAEAATSRILEFSFGMRFGAAREFLREKFTAVVENPYACEALQDLNQSAETTLAQLNQPLPPFVNNFRGLRLSLDELPMQEDSNPADARGHLAVHVEKPEMFVGMAQMFLPDLSSINLVAGDPPVRLPASLIPVPGVVAHAAMSSDAIGLAVGEGEETGLPDFLDRAAGPEGTFLTASYDMAAYLDYTDRLGRRMQAYGLEESAYEVEGDHAVMRIAEAGQAAVSEMMDRSYTTLRFDPEGFLIEGRVTFK